MSSTPASPFPCWAVVAQMGHTQHVGLASETTVAGVAMVRVDLPAVEGDDEREPLAASWVLCAPSSLFGLSPSTEAAALATRRRQRRYRPAPQALLLELVDADEVLPPPPPLHVPGALVDTIEEDEFPY